MAITTKQQQQAPAANLLRFELISPERRIFSGDVTLVLVPGELGEFGILPHHANMLSSVKPGMLTIFTAEGSVSKFYVGAGLADVNDQISAVMTQSVEKLEDLTVEQVQQELENAKQWLSIIHVDDKEASFIIDNVIDIENKLIAAKHK